LVVDDTEDIREMVSIALSTEGYSVTEAADGALARAALLAGIAFDVIVLDLLMPIMDGAHFLEWKCGSAFADLPVVIFSSTTPSVRLEGYAGVVEVVAKLDGLTVLLASIVVALTGLGGIGHLSYARKLRIEPN
jgi:two-component system chemotaxis response regulator CheY